MKKIDLGLLLILAFCVVVVVSLPAHPENPEVAAQPPQGVEWFQIATYSKFAVLRLLDHDYHVMCYTLIDDSRNGFGSPIGTPGGIFCLPWGE